MTEVTMYLIIEDTAVSQKAIRVGERIWLPLSCSKVVPIIDITTKRRSLFTSPEEAKRNGWTRASYYVLDKKGQPVKQTRQKALITMPLALAAAKFPSAFIDATPEVITAAAKAHARADIEQQKESDAYMERREREGNPVSLCGNYPETVLRACDMSV